MAASLRDLRNKIRSIKSTQKITSAMQLMSATRMQRAIRRATEARPYAERAKQLVELIAPSVDVTTQPLFAVRSIRVSFLVVATSNRGLAGQFNTQLIRQYLSWRRDLPSGVDGRVVAVGAKGRAYFLRYDRASLLADFPYPDRVPDYHDISPIGQLVVDEFLAGRVDEVSLLYNHFVSTLRQEPRLIKLLPFAAPATDQETPKEILFEPDRSAILTALLPRQLRVQLYQSLLETYASEQSARMLAMKNATDNAGHLIDDLTLTYNSARQATITGELLDIAAGAAALEG